MNLVDYQAELMEKNDELIIEVYDRLFTLYGIDIVNSQYFNRDKLKVDGKISIKKMVFYSKKITQELMDRLEDDEERDELINEVLASPMYRNNDTLLHEIKTIKEQMERKYKKEINKFNHINYAIVWTFKHVDVLLPNDVLLFLIELGMNDIKRHLDDSKNIIFRDVVYKNILSSIERVTDEILYGELNENHKEFLSKFQF